MNLLQALEKYKKVRRPRWHKDEFIYNDGFNLYDESGEFQPVTMPMLRANDWEQFCPMLEVGKFYRTDCGWKVYIFKKSMLDGDMYPFCGIVENEGTRLNYNYKGEADHRNHAIIQNDCIIGGWEDETSDD